MPVCMMGLKPHNSPDDRSKEHHTSLFSGPAHFVPQLLLSKFLIRSTKFYKIFNNEANTLLIMKIQLEFFRTFSVKVYIVADSRFSLASQQYQDGVKSTVFRVFEDLKFKISEGSDQNWCFPGSAQLAVSVQLRQPTGQTQENTNFGPSLLKF